jgi:hypothetical protein
VFLCFYTSYSPYDEMVPGLVKAIERTTNFSGVRVTRS